MEPSEFRELRLKYFGTQAVTAKILGVSTQSVKNYEAGRRGISPSMEKLINLIVEAKREGEDKGEGE